MPDSQSRSFTGVSLQEAAARRVAVDITCKPVTANGDRGLTSRILGYARQQGGLVLAVPCDAKGRRVYLPDDWRVTLFFSLGTLVLRGQTHVLDHYAYPLYPTRRVDAVILAVPERMEVCERRAEPRHTVEMARNVRACLWPVDPGGLVRGPASCGRVKDFSGQGLGLILPARPHCRVDQPVTVRLEDGHADECLMLRGTVTRINACPSGWEVGLCSVAPVRPGEAVGLMEFLAGAKARTV